MGRERRIAIPSMFGGISDQPPEIRLPHQVAAADNAIVRVQDGISKRPGSSYVTAVTGLTASGNYRLHVIDRDSSERYLVIYGEGTIRIFDTSGTEIPVSISSDATTYLGAQSATADDLRLSTVVDATFILNTLVDLAASRSDSFNVEATHRDYDVMIARQPSTNDSYHRTRADTTIYTAGYWKYEPGLGRFAQWTNTVAADWDDPSDWTVASENPAGMKVEFQRIPMSLTSASWDESELSLTKTDAFVSYTFRTGDQIKVTGGTNIVTGWYDIASKTDKDTIVLTQTISSPTGDHSDVTTSAIGVEAEASWDFTQGSAPSTMQDIALEIQKALRDGGALDALCMYSTEAEGATGDITIVSGWRGSDAKILGINAPSSGFDMSGLSQPFEYANGTATDGSGNPATTTRTPETRWTRVAPPDQDEAKPDSSTMPLQMTRLVDAYYQTIIDDEPFAYFRLGEASGTAAANEVSTTGTGTYVNSPTLGITGALSGDSDTAINLDTTDDRVDLGTLSTFGSSMDDDGFTVEFWTKDPQGFAGPNAAFAGVSNSGTATGFRVVYGTNFGGVFKSGSIGVETVGPGGTNQWRTNLGVIGADGSWHHVVVTVSADQQTCAIYVDGVSLTVIHETVDTSPGTFVDFDEDVTLNMYNLAGTPQDINGADMDEVAFYTRVLSPDEVQQHYDRASQSIVFDVDTVTWSSRTTGDTITNAIPDLWQDGANLADIVHHRNRLVLAGDEDVVFSQQDDLFNFFLDDSTQIVDSDPIEVSLATDRVTLIDFIVPFRQSLLLFTQSAQQFELNAPETLTPSTAAITATTSYQTQSVRPRTIGNSVFFAAQKKNAGQLYEYFYDDNIVAATAAEVSSHVHELLPATVRTLAVSPNNNLVFVLGTDGIDIYVYSFFWVGNQKQQSAWTKWSIESGDRIADIGVIQNDLYLLTEQVSGSGNYVIESIPLTREDAKSGWPYVIHLDRQHELTGSLNGGNTEWTLPSDDETIDTIVLGPDFSTPGQVLNTGITVNGSTVSISGDYTDGEVTLGRRYDMSVELTRPYVRDRNNNADVDAWISLRQLTTTHFESMAYTLRAVISGRTNQEKSLDASAVEASGTTTGWFQGNAEDTTLFILNTTPKPSTITAVEHMVEYAPRQG